MLAKELIEKAKTVNLPDFIETVTGQSALRGSRPEKRRYYSPFRDEKEGSLFVSFKNGIWVWFDFGVSEQNGGDAIKFVMQLKRCSFKEAVESLISFNGCDVALSETGDYHRSDAKGEKLDSILYAKSIYNKLPDNNTSLLNKYFTERGLPFYPEMGCKILNHFKDKTRYLAVPLPNTKNLRGLELREIVNLSQELTGYCERKRKCYGIKTLWVLKRNLSQMIITESVTDSLAGDVLLGLNEATLVALNGVSQVNQLPLLLKSVRPDKVFLALDNDCSGREAQNRVVMILNEFGVNVEVIEIKEKDLFRELCLQKLMHKDAVNLS